MEITPASIHDYCVLHSSQPSPTQVELVEATKRFAPHVAHMQVGNMEGKFLTLIASLMGANHVLEFGTFTGYSALSLAEGVSENGKVVTLDRDPKAVAIAKAHWGKCAEGKKIESLLGDAKESIKLLEAEIAAGKRPHFDLAFIDADKAAYPLYWEACFRLLRKGGAILVDNVLWSGGVLHPEDASDHAIHNFNQLVLRDARVQKVMLPIRDGICLARII